MSATRIRHDRIAAYDETGAPLYASFVLSHEEYQRWQVRQPEPVERVEIDPALVGEVVRLQGRAS